MSIHARAIDKPAERPDKHEAATDEQDQDEETCPNGEAWCEGPKSDELPYFACFLDGREEGR